MAETNNLMIEILKQLQRDSAEIKARLHSIEKHGAGTARQLAIFHETLATFHDDI